MASCSSGAKALASGPRPLASAPPTPVPGYWPQCWLTPTACWSNLAAGERKIWPAWRPPLLLAATAPWPCCPGLLPGVIDRSGLAWGGLSRCNYCCGAVSAWRVPIRSWPPMPIKSPPVPLVWPALSSSHRWLCWSGACCWGRWAAGPCWWPRVMPALAAVASCARGLML